MDFLEKCNKTKGVYLTGWMDIKGMRLALSAAYAFAISSVWETQCIAAYEAAAAGVPLLLSDIPTLSSAFGNLALYHAPSDSKKLAENAEEMLLGKPGSKLLKGLKEFGKKHDVKEYARRLESVFRECIE